MRVALYAVDAGSQFGNKRARHVAAAVRAGLKRHGVSSDVLTSWGGVCADVAVAYGWVHEPIFSAYRKAGGHFVFWDLGYFNRTPKAGSHEGHHRFAVDDWDTAAHMAQACPDDRWRALGVERGRPDPRAQDILVAGMSAKAAGTHGYEPGQWERWAVERVQELAPGSRVVLRAKPSKRARAAQPIEEVLRTVRVLVTHHSNAALDALVAGVPCFAKKGVGSLLSPRVLTHKFLTDPQMPPAEAVDRLLADVAYAQWSPAEMRTGEAWAHIRGLL